MLICPTCGKVIVKSGRSGQSICRHCAIVGMMGDPVAVKGSSDADDYEIRREIGRGGGGTVYLGYDKKVGREVAVKLVSFLHSSDEVGERRFRAEIDAIASLDHPNIIPVYANGEMDGRPFYTMKYIGGGSLETQKEKFAAPRSAADLIAKLARAIHHAHERGILHRDLKPSNILLDEQGEPYITDFGLAKRHDESLELTRTGTVMGTPAYMSPEQARGENSQTTTTSDIFSLGSIFFELLTGRLAFRGENSHVVLRSVIEDEVQLPRGESRKVDRDLETILLKCLEKNPEKRYPSALALADDLARWKRGDPVEARRISSAERTWRMVRRYPVPVGALTLAALSLVAGSIVSLSLWRRSEIAREQSDHEKQAAEENAYYSQVSNALAARARFDFGETRRLLDSAPVERRGFEWRLIDGLSRGDQIWMTDLGRRAPVALINDRSKHRILLLTNDREFHRIDPATGILTLAGKFPDTPGGSPVEVRHPGLRSFSFSPDGNHYSFIDGNQLIIVHAASQKIIFQNRCHTGGTSCWLSSTQIVQANRALDQWTEIKPGVYPPTAWTYDLTTGQKVMLSPKAWAGPIALSPDGTRVAIVQRSKHVAIFRVDQNFQGTPEFLLEGANTVNNFAFTPDGHHLSICRQSDVSHLKIHDLLKGDLLFYQRWPNHAFVDFTHDTHSLIVAGRDPWVTMWSWQKPESATPFFADGHGAGTSYRKDGPFSPPTRFLTRSTSDHRTFFHFGHQAPVRTMLTLDSGDAFLTASDDGSLRAWTRSSSDDISNRRTSVISSHAHHHPTASLNGEYCAYLNLQGQPEIWHRPSGSIHTLPRHLSYLAVFNDGRVLTRHHKTAELICWQLTRGKKPREQWRSYPGKMNWDGYPRIHSSMTPDERYLSVLQPGRIVIVDMEAHTGKTHPDQVMVMGSSAGQTTAISPDGKWAAVTGFLGPCARIYERDDPKKEHRRVIPDVPYTTKDSACAFSRDGTRLYVGNNDGWVRVFALPSLREISRESWQAHTSEVTALSVSQAGEIIATAGGASTILWSAQKNPDKPRRQRLLLTTGEGSRNWLQFCADDTLFFHSGPNRPIEVWEAPRSPQKNGKLDLFNWSREKKRLKALWPF